MTEEVRRRIFEPFFTTKFQGRGVGMASAYGIVKNHDGMIEAESELGGGAAVRSFCPPSKNMRKRLTTPNHAMAEEGRRR